MTRAFIALLAAVSLGAVAVVGSAPAASAATAPGRITFLAATCASSSSMYQRVVAGQDPSSGENGTAADPADIAAYGCSPSSALGFFLLANSTAQSVFTDEALTSPATVSSSESGPAGATIISAGTTVYVPGGVAQSRRFSVSTYPTTITTRAAMPFLDLQCLTDGVNNDNADGAGWGDQAIPAGGQAYCIAYVWDGATTPTATPTSASPTATPTPALPTATPTTVAPTASPSNTPTPSPSAVSSATVSVPVATATATATQPAPTATSTPATLSPTATATATTVTATATPTPPSTLAPTVKKSFVKADAGAVTWRLEPSWPANMVVWDASAVSCEAFDGASCGNIASGGAGMFSSAGGKEQHLLVTQPYKQDGESCSVKNTAEWATTNSAAKRQSVDASYICSGAPTMGWPLFGLFAAGVLALTWAAKKKMQWPE